MQVDEKEEVEQAAVTDETSEEQGAEFECPSYPDDVRLFFFLGVLVAITFLVVLIVL